MIVNSEPLKQLIDDLFKHYAEPVFKLKFWIQTLILHNTVMMIWRYYSWE